MFFRGNPAFYLNHRLGNAFRLQYGTGLTLDDFYALNSWEGEQYKPRMKFRDTRFSFALGLNLYPIQNHPDFYMGAEYKTRRYYCADEDFFHSSSGYWVGAKRLERVIKAKIGFDHEFKTGFNIDIGLGASFLHSSDKWATYYPATTTQESTVESGKEIVEKVMLCIDVQLGIGNRTY